MRNRTKMIAAAAVTAVLAGGSTAVAVASTAGAKPGAPDARVVSAGGKCAPAAARLGVSPARLDQAERAVKSSLAKAGAKPAPDQFGVALARILGIPQGRVRQALAAENRCGSKPGPNDSFGGTHGLVVKILAVGHANKSERPTIIAAVAKYLHISTARVSAALKPLFAANTTTTSKLIAAAARSLGVGPRQLLAALASARQSLAEGQ
jgi:hypothetical protein